MSWYNESRRHALASKGIKTAMKDKPVIYPKKSVRDFEETNTNVSNLLAKRFKSSYDITYYEPEKANESYEDDGAIHVQRGHYRYVFYLQPQGTLTSADVPRFTKAVDKARKNVGRTKEMD